MFVVIIDRIGGVMVGVDREFMSRSGEFKDYTIGICCFLSKPTALRSKIKDWLTRNRVNVSKWSDMSTRGVLFPVR